MEESTFFNHSNSFSIDSFSAHSTFICSSSLSSSGSIFHKANAACAA
jgi:hypothetical protein